MRLRLQPRSFQMTPMAASDGEGDGDGSSNGNGVSEDNVYVDGKDDGDGSNNGNCNGVGNGKGKVNGKGDGDDGGDDGNGNGKCNVCGRWVRLQVISRLRQARMTVVDNDPQGGGPRP